MLRSWLRVDTSMSDSPPHSTSATTRATLAITPVLAPLERL
jgi:hypothetical protein